MNLEFTFHSVYTYDIGVPINYLLVHSLSVAHGIAKILDFDAAKNEL